MRFNNSTRSGGRRWRRARCRHTQLASQTSFLDIPSQTPCCALNLMAQKNHSSQRLAKRPKSNLSWINRRSCFTDAKARFARNASDHLANSGLDGSARGMMQCPCRLRNAANSRKKICDGKERPAFKSIVGVILPSSSSLTSLPRGGRPRQICERIRTLPLH